MTFIAPLAAAVTLARSGRTNGLQFLASPTFYLAIAPYLALTALLPVLGVMFNGYPDRTLLSVADATTALSFLVMGAGLSFEREHPWSRWLLFGMVLQLIYAAGQAIYANAGPGRELFAPFHAWDLSLVDLNTFVQARSSGLYLNPNELGLWAAITAILAWTLLSPRLRSVGLGIAFLTLLLSQSRGSALALLAAVTIGVAIAFRHSRPSARSMKSMVSLAVAGVLTLVAASVVVPQASLGDRLGSIFAVLANGPQADANLSGRIDYWSAVTSLNAAYPWGTLGSPELILGTAIDSSWFRAFAQGSIVYVLALSLVIAGAVFLRPSRFGQSLRLMAIVIAVAAITQTPFGYPVIFLFWVLLGAELQASALGLAAAPTIDRSLMGVRRTSARVGRRARAHRPPTCPGS